MPYTGANAGALTVLGELNKLASNLRLSRNIAGVHRRKYYAESVVMGERIALYLLQETANTYHEDMSFHTRAFETKNVTFREGERREFPRCSLW